MTKRIVIGDRGGGQFGMFVSLPGYDVTTENPADRTKFAFSSTWGNTVGVAMSGTVAGETWVTLPASVDYMPVVHFDRVVSSSQYALPSTQQIIGARPSNWEFSDFSVAFQEVSGTRQFRVIATSYGSSASYTFRYIVFTMKICD